MAENEQTDTPCPTDVELRAYADDELGEADAARVEAHLVDCADCRSGLAIYASLLAPDAGDEDEEAIERLARDTLDVARDTWKAQVESRAPEKRGNVVRWPRGTGPLLALAASVAVCAAAAWWLTHRGEPSRLERGERALATVFAERRPTDMRLSGAPYAPYRGARGSGDERAESARALLEAAAAEGATAPALHQLGRARLAAGDAAAAVDALDRAHGLAPDDLDVLVDRAAAFAATGDATRARSDLQRALERDPRRADALFDLAVLDRQEGDRDAERAAWARYLEVDPSSPWADEAHRALAALGAATNP